MFKIEELIKQANIDISVPSKKFVYFNKETGVINSISSKKNNEDNYIEIETSKIIDILNGTKNTNDFIVKYSIKLQEYIICNTNYESSKSFRKDMYLFEIPRYSNTNLVFKREYIGIYVDVWYNELEHFLGQHVWYNNAVYRLTSDQEKDTDFDIGNVEIVVDRVKLYNDNNKYLNFDRKLKRGDLILDYNKIYSVHEDSTIINKTEEVDDSNTVEDDLEEIDESVIVEDYLEEIYKGIFVDVWYKELSHIKGQHVWYNNAVYRLTSDQEKDTDFDIGNVEIVVDNVKLFNDSNKKLDFEAVIDFGDSLLSNNRLYLSKVSNSTKKKTADKKIDFFIKQNNKNNFWSFSLNEKIKSELNINKENLNRKIVVGVTSKEDPNCLYRLFEINLTDLVNKAAVIFKYQFPFEFDHEEVSIYTSKYFEEYSYEVINEQ